MKVVLEPAVQQAAQQEQAGQRHHHQQQDGGHHLDEQKFDVAHRSASQQTSQHSAGQTRQFQF